MADGQDVHKYTVSSLSKLTALMHLFYSNIMGYILTLTYPAWGWGWCEKKEGRGEKNVHIAGSQNQTQDLLCARQASVAAHHGVVAWQVSLFMHIR